MKPYRLILILVLSILTACDGSDDTGKDVVRIPPDNGSLEFRYILPEYKIPKDGIHRVSLSFAYSADSMYRGQFFQKANVSDFQEVYTVFFLPAEYYYVAVITCSCGGDTCLNGGFPGGRFGMKYNFNKFEIVKQEVTVIETHFQ